MANKKEKEKKKEKMYRYRKSSITSVITSGGNTLQIITCDLVRAEENLGSTVFFISLDKQSLARKL